MAGKQGFDRESIIGALASAMGQGDYVSTKYEESRYDESTKTLYCQGYMITSSTIDEALNYFIMAKKKNEKLAEADTTVRNTNLYFQVAIEAIKMMTEGEKGA